MPGCAVEVISRDSLTPVIVVDVPATPGAESGLVTLLYGHFDKQPPLGSWREGLDAFTAVREGDRSTAGVLPMTATRYSQPWEPSKPWPRLVARTGVAYFSWSQARRAGAHTSGHISTRSQPASVGLVPAWLSAWTRAVPPTTGSGTRPR